MQHSLNIPRFSIKIGLAVAIFTSLTLLNGCATTGSSASSTSNTPKMELNCKPLSPNSDIVSVTASVIDTATIHAYIKRRGDAIGKSYFSNGSPMSERNNGIFQFDTGEKVQCRSL